MAEIDVATLMEKAPAICHARTSSGAHKCDDGIGLAGLPIAINH